MSGISSGTVAGSQVGHTYLITYTVMDSTGQTASDQVTITVASSLTASLTANREHNLTVGVGSTIDYGWSSAYAVSADSSYTVDGGGPFTWVANSLRGTSLGRVAASQAGNTYVITYTVMDSADHAASDQVTITVTALSALEITSGSPPNWSAGVSYDVHCAQIPPCNVLSLGSPLTATGGVQPYTWNWAAATGSSLPPGLRVAPFQGLIHGIPTTPGFYNVVVTVTDSASPATTKSANYEILIHAL